MESEKKLDENELKKVMDFFDSYALRLKNSDTLHLRPGLMIKFENKPCPEPSELTGIAQQIQLRMSKSQAHKTKLKFVFQQAIRNENVNTYVYGRKLTPDLP